jgi:sulfate adenylyltransferase subunit 1 (EFTu-like GTPase family)
MAAEFRAFAEDLGVDRIAFIPLAARDGDNIAFRSLRMRWYQGPCLFEYLENVEIAPRPQAPVLRMPVQWVNRPDSRFRGYCGLIASGELLPGMPVRVLLSGQRTHIARIVTQDGDLAHAVAGQAVTVTLSDDIDVSGAETFASADVPVAVTNRILAIGAEKLILGRPYLLKLTTATVKARVDP